MASYSISAVGQRTYLITALRSDAHCLSMSKSIIHIELATAAVTCCKCVEWHSRIECVCVHSQWKQYDLSGDACRITAVFQCTVSIYWTAFFLFLSFSLSCYFLYFFFVCLSDHKTNTFGIPNEPHCVAATLFLSRLYRLDHVKRKRHFSSHAVDSKMRDRFLSLVIVSISTALLNFIYLYFVCSSFNFWTNEFSVHTQVCIIAIVRSSLHHCASSTTLIFEFN